MTKDAYPALFHYIHKAIAKVDFPCAKAELLANAGEEPVYVDWGRSQPLRSLAAPIPSDHFTCAADFYCKLIASL